MKTILGLCTFFLLTSSSYARTPMPENLKADIHTARFDAYSPYSDRGFSGGEISIGHIEKKITLTLFLNPECPRGSVCIAVIDVEKIKLSLVSVKRDECGVVRFTGESESGLKDIKVVDYTQSHCVDPVLRPATFIEYNASYFDADLGYRFETRSTFSAEKLKMRTRMPIPGPYSTAPLR